MKWLFIAAMVSVSFPSNSVGTVPAAPLDARSALMDQRRWPVRGSLRGTLRGRLRGGIAADELALRQFRPGTVDT